MRSSFVAFAFSMFIVVIAFSYSYHLMTFKSAVNKSEDKITRLHSNEDYIDVIPFIVNREKDNGYTKLFNALSKLENNNLKINITDISSRLDLNFVDFTLFQNAPLKGVLNEQFTWKTLYEYRNEVGFTGDKSIYDKFFKEQEEELFTMFSIVNIGNGADDMLERFYTEFTGNEGKAVSFKKEIVNNRKNFIILDEQKYNKFLYRYDRDIKEYVNIYPSFNINFVPEIILKTILTKEYRGTKISNAIGKFAHIVTLRKSRELNEKDIKNILQLSEKQESCLTFLGDKTTFWGIEIIDSEQKLKTNFILGLYKENYRVVSLTSELL